MRQSYEILRDPSDRYLVWDVDRDSPVVSANRILTFPALAESRRFLEVLEERLGPGREPDRRAAFRCDAQKR